MNAREVLKDRDGIVRSISPDDTVFDAIKAMDSFKVGALMVIDKSEKLVDIISERDYTRERSCSRIVPPIPPRYP